MDGALFAKSGKRVVFLQFAPYSPSTLHCAWDQFGDRCIRQITKGCIGPDEAAAALVRVGCACGSGGRPIPGYFWKGGGPPIASGCGKAAPRPPANFANRERPQPAV